VILLMESLMAKENKFTKMVKDILGNLKMA
jgi:hypothetical protein